MKKYLILTAFILPTSLLANIYNPVVDHSPIKVDHSPIKNAYVFVTGPGLDGEKNSSKVKSTTFGLAQHLESRDKNSLFVCLKDFSKDSLDSVGSNLRSCMGENLHITFLFNAHGFECSDGRYLMQSDSGLIGDKELLSILPKKNITLGLLTCHSGAFNVPQGVDAFGASSNKTLCYESTFNNFVREVKRTNNMLTTSWDFFNAWKKSQAPFGENFWSVSSGLVVGKKYGY